LVVEPTPLKNDGLKVSWDDEDLPTEWKINPNVPNHQPNSFAGKYQWILWVQITP
jgi:hypothetical protein